MIVFPLSNLDILAVLFFTIALIYSSVGFGGGSAYLALLALTDMAHREMAMVALLCNIIVVSAGCFSRRRDISLSFLLPFLLFSVPLAYLGGQTVAEREIYRMVLGIALFIAALVMLLPRWPRASSPRPLPLVLALFLGGGIGFLSGFVGIGGGIFLAPLLYLLNLANSRKITATASSFILINSVAGLVGQGQKTMGLGPLWVYSPFFVAVFLGGQLGSWSSLKYFRHRHIEVLTALLILAVSLKILIESFL